MTKRRTFPHFGLIAIAFFFGAAAAEEPAPPYEAEDALFAELFDEAPPRESPDDLIRISEIKVSRPDSFTEGYVLSLAREISLGGVYPRSELEKRLQEITERFRLSGMFYEGYAAYRVLDASAGEDGEFDARITLSVSEGFWWGFNFNPWDFFLCYANLGDEGKQAGLTAGLNTQALSYRDPSILNGPFFFGVELKHSLSRGGGHIDPAYLSENVSLGGELGWKPEDDLAFSIGGGYLWFRSPQASFLYPDFKSLPDSDLARLGFSSDFSQFGVARLNAGLGNYGFKKRGGMRGRVSGSIIAYLPSGAMGEPILELTGDCNIRYDAPSLVRVNLYEHVEYFPFARMGKGIPEPLWADLAECRSPSGLSSGEFASLTRLSLSLDSVAAFSMNFTSLSLIPELYYEFAMVRRASYGAESSYGQACGLLLKAAFAVPVSRTFSFGIGFGLKASGSPSVNFVFEVE